MASQLFLQRRFARNIAAAKRATAKGQPMIIRDRGRPAFALLRIEDYARLSTRRASSLLDVMDAIPGGIGIEFDVPQINFGPYTNPFD
jgi:hypothetical protein